LNIHHLNCGTLCPRGGRFVVGAPGELVCHCLLIELSDGLCLVDTGLGSEDMQYFERRLPVGFRSIVRKPKDPSEAALMQVQKLGFSAKDVRHIVVTHLDVDHAGGLVDFPDATVHVHSVEHLCAIQRKSFVQRHRYQSTQWSHGPKWMISEDKGDLWFGFDGVRTLKGLPPEILLVPLAGHTDGHCGVAIHSEGSWVFHAGDAYFHRNEMENIAAPWGLTVFQLLLESSAKMRKENQERLRVLKRDRTTKIFCSHDPIEFPLTPR
jgi:glyoxylase-like metal-dependent hydrolase (beta-lactamase superfamily II)